MDWPPWVTPAMILAAAIWIVREIRTLGERLAHLEGRIDHRLAGPQRRSADRPPRLGPPAPAPRRPAAPGAPARRDALGSQTARLRARQSRASPAHAPARLHGRRTPIAEPRPPYLPLAVALGFALPAPDAEPAALDRLPPALVADSRRVEPGALSRRARSRSVARSAAKSSHVGTGSGAAVLAYAGSAMDSAPGIPIPRQASSHGNGTAGRRPGRSFTIRPRPPRPRRRTRTARPRP